MIYHPVAKLAEAGIKDILVVTGREHMGAVVGTLGSGRELGLEFTYRVQDQAGGIAQALGLAEHFAGTDKCVVILGDNIFKDNIAPFAKSFDNGGFGAKLLLKEVPDPQRYGVAEVINGSIVSIEEKPQHPKSSLCVTGIYMYDNRVFDIIKTLKPSGRGELEITDVNNAYISMNAMSYDVFEGWWTDAGTFDSLALANGLAGDMELSLGVAL
jgi:glucose-1-phosphate thymidylyltransferase